MSGATRKIGDRVRSRRTYYDHNNREIPPGTILVVTNVDRTLNRTRYVCRLEEEIEDLYGYWSLLTHNWDNVSEAKPFTDEEYRDFFI